MGCSSSQVRKNCDDNTLKLTEKSIAAVESVTTKCGTPDTENDSSSVKNETDATLDKLYPVDIFKDVKFEIPEDAQAVEISAKVTYRGQWANGRQHGVGETKYADGSVYLGQYKDGKPHGQGIFKTKDGSEYSGHFQEGKAHGYGVYKDKDGSIYTGPYINDRREGVGREIQADGLQYVGEYTKGNKHGKGELVAPNGEKYKGDFFNGEIHGVGTYTWPDGRIYTGQWERNRQNGQAEFRWPDGRVYNGHYTNGRLQGYGVLEWKDGRKYDGQWKNGLQNGIGKYWGSPHWYREAQFLDGVRVKWLGDIVHVDDKTIKENQEKSASTVPSEKSQSPLAQLTPKKVNMPSPRQNESTGPCLIEEELHHLKGTVAQRIAQFGQRAAVS